jgi:hypothetical protein
MRRRILMLALVLTPVTLTAQAGKFPPDSLVNVKVIPKGTSVIQVIGQMRNFAGWLGVRCQFCHIGEEGQPLDRFDFVSDQKRTKVIARQMMMMAAEINRRLDSLPQRTTPAISVTCMTCHRGISRPMPLSTVVSDAAIAVNADSALRAYRMLRERYFGKDAFDFSESSLNIAAFRTGRASATKVNDALSILQFNETLFPNSSGMYVFRGNILLMKADTAAAAVAFRRAVQLDSTNAEARGRLTAIGQRP